MKKSIYAQLVLIFLLIIFLGNFTSSFIAAATVESSLLAELSNSLNGVLSAAKDVYEKGEMPPNDIEKLYASGFITVKFYGNTNELIEDYNLSAENIKAVSEKPITFHDKSHGRLNLKIPISVVKSGDVYLVSVLQGNNMFANFRTIILSYNLLSILCGTIVMLIAARIIVRPIKKLTSATEKIAKGDFEVYIKRDRKDEIGQLVDNFNKMTKELAGMEMMRNSFISDISHEFKTPLTSIEGYTKLLRDCENDIKRNEYIDIITEETKRLSALSGNILLLNRIENENINLTKNSFRLDEQIRHVILLCENKWSSKNIDLNIYLDEIIYTGNEQLLFQIWLNLIDNAIKFSNHDESIEISLRKQEDKIQFSIMDYGKGMTAEQQQRMFEKFYTGDKSRNSEGNGLGLSIVKRVIDMHGGTIEVQSRLDEFTQVKIIL
ncbi:MAG: hssS [Clostridia bacterium]|nr:hssS [Clostridia bacterium]